MSLFRDVPGNTALIREMPLAGIILQPGGTAPTQVSIGTTPTVPARLFDAVGELAAGTFQMPIDWDPSTNPVIVLKWSLAVGETNADVASWTLDYTVSRVLSTTNGPGRANTQILATTTVTTGNGLVAGDVYTTEFTLDRTNATNPIVAGNAVHPEIHLTNLVGVGAVHLTDAFLRYEALY